jgi:hypothetical protein
MVISVLWRRRCRQCGQRFLLCTGHRARQYCSKSCAAEAREGSKRRARRKHQASAEGLADHRQHQRDYRRRKRERKATGSVMDHCFGNLAVVSRVCVDHARDDHSHDQGDQYSDGAIGQRGSRRDLDCTFRRWRCGTKTGCELCCLRPTRKLHHRVAWSTGLALVSATCTSGSTSCSRTTAVAECACVASATCASFALTRDGSHHGDSAVSNRDAGL